MISDLIVLGSAAASLAFVLAWVVRPDLRVWIERPKYEFLAAVQQYDRTRPRAGQRKETHST
jgi:hypothetical protein